MRTSIAALFLSVVSLFATQVRAANPVQAVNKPADMRGRFTHALRFHERGLAQLEAATKRVGAKSANAPVTGMLYGHLRRVHERGVEFAKTGLELANQAPRRVAREDAFAESADHKAATMDAWRGVGNMKVSVGEIGRELNGKAR